MIDREKYREWSNDALSNLLVAKRRQIREERNNLRRSIYRSEIMDIIKELENREHHRAPSATRA